MIVYMATDHAGWSCKEYIKKSLSQMGYLVKDFGAEQLDPEDNYPDYIIPCIKEFTQKTGGDPKKGIAIVFGGSGTGEAICANRFKGARAVVCNSINMELVRLARQHNNANVISVGARFISPEITLTAIKVFMETNFEGGRHAKRVLELDTI